MAIKLKSVLRNPKLRLALKALVFAGFFQLIKLGDFGFWPVLLFTAATIFFYSVPLFRTLELMSVLLVFFADALLISWTFLASSYFSLLTLYFAAVFYLILGVKDLAFTNREVWYRILNVALAYPAFILFFYNSQSALLPKTVLIFLATLILVKSVINKKIAVWLITFLTLEILWAISLLPIGFINSANLALLVYFALIDLAYHYYVSKNLSHRKILTNSTVFLIVVLLILGFSRWSL